MITPGEILSRVRETYAACRSYRDIGEVSSVTINGPRPWQRSTSRKPFQTAFVRPGRFLFEFKDMTVGPSDEWAHHAVWQNAGSAFRWSTSRLESAVDAEPCPSVEGELLAMAGISLRASRRIPGLLGAFGKDGDLPPGHRTELVGIERIDDRDSWRLRAARSTDVTMLWVDVERALVLRSLEHTIFTPETDRAQRERQLAHPGLSDEFREMITSVPPLERTFATETTTFYRPEIDIEIPDSAFELSPPG